MISEREFDRAIAWRLRVLREAQGATQPEFGKVIGVGGTAVSNYEANGRGITAFQALKLKLAYEAPLEWLLGGSEGGLSDDLKVKLRAAEKRLLERDAAKARRSVKATGKRAKRSA